MTTTETTVAGQLVIHRLALGNDHRFVTRCQDGAHGHLVADIAHDILARDTAATDDITDALLADAIIAEVSQHQQDALPFAA
jgi:hypothetical protein